MSTSMNLHNSLRTRRLARGWSQQQLADRAGIARASVSAIEIERLVPSTAAALSLAAALDCHVEDLFQLPGQSPAESTWAWARPDQEYRFWQAEVAGRTRIYPYESSELGTIEHDGTVAEGLLQNRAASPPATLVMATCDPAVALLAGELAREASVRLLAFCRSSRGALALLKQGLVHVAGLHLSRADREGNAAAVRAEIGAGYQLVRVAQWEEGVATTSDRSSSVRSLVKSRMRWVGREAGSGARECLDELLGTRSAPRRMARNHRGVVEAVRGGWADAGVCLRLTAEEANLKFLPVREEAYDLCFVKAMGTDPRIQALLKVLRSTAYQTMLNDLPGYRAKNTGAVMAIN
jgi:molybdate-binding protein/transcriptional regulator with XRE-family HTH domain